MKLAALLISLLAAGLPGAAVTVQQLSVTEHTATVRVTDPLAPRPAEISCIDAMTQFEITTPLSSVSGQTASPSLQVTLRNLPAATPIAYKLTIGEGASAETRYYYNAEWDWTTFFEEIPSGGVSGLQVSELASEIGDAPLPFLRTIAWAVSGETATIQRRVYGAMRRGLLEGSRAHLEAIQDLQISQQRESREVPAPAQ